MNSIPDIINSQIINADYDIFWLAPEQITTLPQRDVLVASTPFVRESPEEIQLLKMLQACQLKESDYNIIQFGDADKIAWHVLRDHLHLKSIILLGILPAQLGVSAQLMPHQLSRFNNCNWIVTDNLETLLQRQEIKTHLWNYGLKPAFVEKVYG